MPTSLFSGFGNICCEQIFERILRFQIVAAIASIHPKDTEAPPAGVDDMTKLAYLHEPGVLHNLASRFALNEIYVNNHFRRILITKAAIKRSLRWLINRLIISKNVQTYTGNILIAVNPFQRLPHLYDVQMMQQYKGAAFGELSPHLFAIADACYRYILGAS